MSAVLLALSGWRCSSPLPRGWSPWTRTRATATIFTRFRPDTVIVATRRRWRYELRNGGTTTVSLDYTLGVSPSDTAWRNVLYDLAPGETQEGSEWFSAHATSIAVDARIRR